VVIRLATVNALQGWKIGDGVVGLWPQRTRSYFLGSKLPCKVSSKLSGNCDRKRGHRQTDRQTHTHTEKWFHNLSQAMGQIKTSRSSQKSHLQHRWIETLSGPPWLFQVFLTQALIFLKPPDIYRQAYVYSLFAVLLVHVNLTALRLFILWLSQLR